MANIPVLAIVRCASPVWNLTRSVSIYSSGFTLKLTKAFQNDIAKNYQFDSSLTNLHKNQLEYDQRYETCKWPAQHYKYHLELTDRPQKTLTREKWCRYIVLLLISVSKLYVKTTSKLKIEVKGLLDLSPWYKAKATNQQIT